MVNEIINKIKEICPNQASEIDNFINKKFK